MAAVSQWACHLCSFLNSEEDRKCEMCLADRDRDGKSKTVEVPFGEAEAEEWECTLCTVRNPPTYLACMMCNSKRFSRPAFDRHVSDEGVEDFKQDPEKEVVNFRFRIQTMAITAEVEADIPVKDAKPSAHGQLHRPALARQSSEEMRKHWNAVHDPLPQYRKAHGMICLEKKWLPHTTQGRIMIAMQAQFREDPELERRCSSHAHFTNIMTKVIKKGYKCQNPQHQKCSLTGHSILSTSQHFFSRGGWRQPYLCFSMSLILAYDTPDTIIAKCGEMCDRANRCESAQRLGFNLIVRHAYKLMEEAQRFGLKHGGGRGGGGKGNGENRKHASGAAAASGAGFFRGMFDAIFGSDSREERSGGERRSKPIKVIKDKRPAKGFRWMPKLPNQTKDCTMKVKDISAEKHCEGISKINDKIGKVFRYSKGVAKTLPFQWCGWQHHTSAGKWIRMSTWIRFIDKVPPPSSNFGLKIHGSIQNEWVRELRPNEWGFVSAIAPGSNRDGSHLLLIFDSIAEKQEVEFAGLKCDIFETAREAEGFNNREAQKVLQLSMLPEHVDWVAAETGKNLRGGKAAAAAGDEAIVGAVESLTIKYHTERGVYMKTAKAKEVLEIYAAKLVVLRALLTTSNGSVDVTDIVQENVGSDTVSKIEIDRRLDQLLVKHRLGEHAVSLHNLGFRTAEALVGVKTDELAKALSVAKKPIIRRLHRLLEEIKKELGHVGGEEAKGEEENERKEGDVDEASMSPEVKRKALIHFYECVEDYLDEHKERAYQSGLEQPARFLYKIYGSDFGVDHVNVHAINWYLALLHAGLGIQTPYLPHYHDNCVMGVHDYWAGLSDAAWHEVFSRPENFGKKMEGIRAIRGVRKGHRGGKFFKKSVGDGELPQGYRASRPFELGLKITDPSGGNRKWREKFALYLERYAYFFTYDFLIPKMFSNLNSESKQVYSGVRKSLEILYQHYRREGFGSGGEGGKTSDKVADLRLTEDTLVEHVYKDEYFEDLDLWRTARFFAWLGVVQWSEMMERSVNEGLTKRADELEAEAVAARAAATAAAAAAAASGGRTEDGDEESKDKGENEEGSEQTELEALEAQMKAIGKEMQAAMRKRDRKVIAAVMQKRKKIQARIGELRG